VSKRLGLRLVKPKGREYMKVFEDAALKRVACKLVSRGCLNGDLSLQINITRVQGGPADQ
jgi:hypothetical protein